MLLYRTYKQKSSFLLLLFIFAGISVQAQTTKRVQPVWWFGESVGANFNTYRGTTQRLNNFFSVPAAFHKGNGVKPYISILTEYRPNKTWGGMLNVAFDNRGGRFNTVAAPCDCPADLSTNISYVSIEPALRIAPFSSAFYVFAGPTIGLNVAKSYTYLQEKQTDKRGEWSEVRSSLLSAQAGAGIDIPLSSPTNTTQFTLSPFASFQTDLGQSPRKIESWALYTVRTGIALKFGTGRKEAKAITVVDRFIPAEKEIQFSVRAPKVVSPGRQVKETFPLRNTVFFDLGSSQIPARYVQLNAAGAKSFREEQLQDGQPDNLNRGRSTRQLAVYHNILNIIGDRLRENSGTSINLAGASDKNPAEGKVMADNIRQYLVTYFGIDASRITIEGRDKPLIPSEQAGATKELALLREGDRRVDISSTSPELLLQVGGTTSMFFKPVQIKALQQDPLDSHVIFNAERASELLSSWTVDITDEKGTVQHYGPYTTDKASVSGKTILGENTQGNYKVVLLGQTKSGNTIRKESSVSLVKSAAPGQEGLRYSILFDFDKSKSIAAYEKFLTEVVMPLIPANSRVIIQGHTDVIGDEKYNHTLSHDRATGTQSILEKALLSKGIKGVKFDVFGYGEDADMAPFENNLPEERFYNRTVIIDIISGK